MIDPTICSVRVVCQGRTVGFQARPYGQTLFPDPRFLAMVVGNLRDLGLNLSLECLSESGRIVPVEWFVHYLEGDWYLDITLVPEDVFEEEEE
jgi:hypothetical protein